MLPPSHFPLPKEGEEKKEVLLINPLLLTYVGKERKREMGNMKKLSVFSFQNLLKAFQKCRKGKRFKEETGLFEFNLEQNLFNLEKELNSRKWQPRKVHRFIVLEPKPREIIAATFRDRVVHHLVHSQINPLFEKRFIYDSYANRKNKGTHKAINRLQQFIRKITKNYTQPAFYLKGDVKSYFPTVDHQILFEIVKEMVKDEEILVIIENRATGLEKFKPSPKDPTFQKSLLLQPSGKGMPIGNLTSQLFANIYLDKLDHFIKEKLRAKFYLRYVDDFIIIDTSRKKLKFFAKRIDGFLKKKLKQSLHPRKTKILPLSYGIDFLGYYFKISQQSRKIIIYVRHSNVRRFKYRLIKLTKLYQEGKITEKYICESINAWYAYAKHANSYNLRKHLFKEHMKPFHSFLEPQDDFRYFKLKSIE